MSGPSGVSAGRQVLALYDSALPEVYGYLLDRCGDRYIAEDLTSETFLAVVRAERLPGSGPMSVPWLIGVARHKLADHWRRRYRDERLTEALTQDLDEAEDPWDETLDQLRATHVLAELADHHRMALTFRYLDGLAVPEVAELLGRTVHATEALLVRARIAFRRLFEKGEGDAG